MTDEMPAWERIEVQVPYFNELMKKRKAALVHQYLNPPPGWGRWIGGAHHPSKWRKEEIAWEIARKQARADFDAGKLGP